MMALKFYWISLMVAFLGATILVARDTLSLRLTGALKVSRVLRSLIFFGFLMTIGCAQSTVTDDDYEIFEIVLTDLAGRNDFPGIDKNSKKVILHDTTLFFAQDTTSKKAEPEFIADMIRRNLRAQSLRHFTPKNPNIIVANVPLFDEPFLDFPRMFHGVRGYVKAYLPGYSKDGRTAYFRFSFGPTEHGAFGYYLLQKVNGKWNIVEGRLQYFS